jgi:hypothetical protein
MPLCIATGSVFFEGHNVPSVVSFAVGHKRWFIATMCVNFSFNWASRTKLFHEVYNLFLFQQENPVPQWVFKLNGALNIAERLLFNG